MFTFPICVSAQTETFNDTIAFYLSEIQTTTKQNINLWGDDLYGPVLFVQPNTRQVFSNYSDLAGVLKKDGIIYTGILPNEINIANTSVSWNGRDWAMIMLPLPENRNSRINLLAHELFHRAQAGLGFNAHNPSNNHLDQKEGRIYMRLELDALKKAALAISPSEEIEHLTNALIFRKYRHTIFSDAATTENLLELNEGIAEYTGVIISEREDHEMREHFITRINRFLDNPSFVRSFAYETIPVYGYLLRDIKKDWNKEIDDNTDLTEYFLNAYKIQLPKDLETAAFEVTDQYNGQRIHAEETVREERVKKILAEYKNKFVHKPHLVIRFEKMSISFDPRNITPLESFGTVYPNIRVTDNWGILSVEKGALMSPNWDIITVSIPTEIVKNKASGNGWILELKDGYAVQKDKASSNYILTKK